MIAGMLTAIKSFVEDAMLGENKVWNLLNMSCYKIHIKNYHYYYFAVVISGNINESIKDKFENELLDFAFNTIKFDIEKKVYDY